MRRNRIIWLVLFILSIVGISYYGGPISYGFFYAMLFIPLVSLLYLLYVAIFFRIYEYNDGKEFVADNPVPYSFRLINEYHLPFVGIRVKFFSSFSTINELSDKTEYELMPGTGITKETTIVCHYRGEYEIGIKEVIFQDYFRLFKIKHINREAKRAIVNPKIVNLSYLSSFEMHAEDVQNSPSKPDILTREYVAGDDVRFINWSQSARTGTLMTREMIGEAGKGVSIILDACRYSKDQMEYLPVENKMLELVIALSLFYCNKNISSTEIHFSSQPLFSVVDNHQQFDELYKKLSNLHFDAENTQKQLFGALAGDKTVSGSALVYMVLSSISEYAFEMINDLSQRGTFTVAYVVSNESIVMPPVTRPDMVNIITVSPEAKLEEVLS